MPKTVKRLLHFCIKQYFDANAIAAAKSAQAVTEGLAVSITLKGSDEKNVETCSAARNNIRGIKAAAAAAGVKMNPASKTTSAMGKARLIRGSTIMLLISE